MARIVKDPEVLCGKATIEGTRLSVELILGYLAGGTSVDELLENYPGLTQEGILACLSYALDLVELDPPATPSTAGPQSLPDRLAG